MAIEVGNVFEGRVTGVKPFGAFVALPEGRVGMVHISEVSNEFVQDIAAVLHDGDTVKVQVINVAPVFFQEVPYQYAVDYPVLRHASYFPQGMRLFLRVADNHPYSQDSS